MMKDDMMIMIFRSRLLDQTKMGLSGYNPNMEDMRGIFLAKGPGEMVRW